MNSPENSLPSEDAVYKDSKPTKLADLIQQADPNRGNISDIELARVGAEAEEEYRVNAAKNGNEGGVDIYSDIGGSQAMNYEVWKRAFEAQVPPDQRGNEYQRVLEARKLGEYYESYDPAIKQAEAVANDARDEVSRAMPRHKASAHYDFTPEQRTERAAREASGELPPITPSENNN